MTLTVAIMRSGLLSRLPRLRYRLLLAAGWPARRGITGPTRWATTPAGHQIQCDLRDPMQARIYFLGSYSEDEIEELRHELQPGDVLADIGANIGLFSLELSQAVLPGGTIWAFEPAPDTADRLEQNLAANGLENAIRVMRMALGQEKGELPLVAPTDDPLDTGRRSLAGSGTQIGVVPVAVFDDLVDDGVLALERGLHGVKIDVEGAELDVLRGMERSLRRWRPRVVMVETIEEHLAAFGSSVSSLDAFMSSLGYGRSSPEGTLNSVYRPV